MSSLCMNDAGGGETVGWQMEGPQAEVEIWLGHGMNINISENESKDKIIDKKGKKENCT